MLSSIYFINTRELSKKLALGQVPENIAFLHFLIHAILVSAAIPYQIDMIWAGEKPDSLLASIFSFILFALIQYWGLVRIYKINKSIDGKDFFLRYAALSLPILVQITILGVFVTWAYALLITPIAENHHEDISTTLWQIIVNALTAVMTVIFFKLYFNSFYQIKEHLNDAKNN